MLFRSAAETKWQTMNGVVMLLPHGYEGQGPEHSSARLERYLQQCAELNMVVTNITTAANLFHALRRQLTWDFRKPMVNFSPKANLRHPGSYSDLSEFILDRPGIKLWTHGHTHENFDYMIGSTRIVCNPRGYDGYEDIADNFSLKVIEL